MNAPNGKKSIGLPGGGLTTPPTRRNRPGGGNPSCTVSLMTMAAVFRVSSGQTDFKVWQIGMTTLD